MNFFEWFLRSNNTWARLLRTVVQGLLSVLITELPTIIGLFNIPDYLQAIIVALLMAILSPIMAEIGKTVEAVGARKRYAQDNAPQDDDEVKARGFIK